MKPEKGEVLKTIIHAYCCDCLGRPDRKVEDCKGCPVDVAIKATVGG